MKKLKEKLKKKLGQNGGFTLVEMLIVVAIIAILVAVSIPMVSTSLDKAKTATDDANMRAAKAAATVEYYDNGGSLSNTYYDIETGKMVSTAPTPGYNQTKQGTYEPENAVLQVTVTPGSGDKGATITVDWAAKG